MSLLVDIQIKVEAALTVRRGHEIAHDVKNALLGAPFAISDVSVHVEPAED
ncbi:MAG TPA: cation transporter dimerization domain-containing protein [Opitutaceae bacterium]|nr:cation transporter dimerization domain-containing protein [Opitutaceae bacterium]